MNEAENKVKEYIERAGKITVNTAFYSDTILVAQMLQREEHHAIRSVVINNNTDIPLHINQYYKDGKLHIIIREEYFNKSKE